MNFNEFIENVQAELPQHFTDAFKKAEVSTTEVNKLQGESYSGITIRPENGDVGVTINTEKFFEDYNAGRNMDSIVSSIAENAEYHLSEVPQLDKNQFMDYEAMKPSLMIQMVGKDSNAEMLQSVPHQDMEDMAVVYRFALQQTEEGTASILVNNRMMESYGITQEQLHNDAIENAVLNHPANIRNMNEVIASMMGDMFPMPDEPAPMYVATNDNSFHGAGVMAYPDFMEQATEKLGGSFYILPSSIHEIIMIPDEFQMNAQELKAMVTEVNGSEIDPAERLTDNVYHYDADAKVLEQADKFEKRQMEKEPRKSVLEQLEQKVKETAAKIPKEHTAPKRAEVAL